MCEKTNPNDQPSPEERRAALREISEIGGDGPLIKRPKATYGDIISPIDEERDAEKDGPPISARSLEMADRSMENLEKGVFGDSLDPEDVSSDTPGANDVNTYNAETRAALRETEDGVEIVKSDSEEDFFEDLDR